MNGISHCADYKASLFSAGLSAFAGIYMLALLVVFEFFCKLPESIFSFGHLHTHGLNGAYIGYAVVIMSAACFALHMLNAFAERNCREESCGVGPWF